MEVRFKLLKAPDADGVAVAGRTEQRDFTSYDSTRATRPTPAVSAAHRL